MLNIAVLSNHNIFKLVSDVENLIQNSFPEKFIKKNVNKLFRVIILNVFSYFRHFSPNLQRRQYLTPSQQLTKFSQVMAEPQQPVSSPETPDDKFILPLGDTCDLSDVMLKFEKELSNSMYVNGSPEVSRGSESRISQDVGNDLPESERDLHIILPKLENGHEKKVVRKKKEEKSRERQRKGAELPSFLRPKKCDPEEMALREEKERLVHTVGTLKANVHSIQQQEEEILREVHFF